MTNPEQLYLFLPMFARNCLVSAEGWSDALLVPYVELSYRIIALKPVAALWRILRYGPVRAEAASPLGRFARSPCAAMNAKPVVLHRSCSTRPTELDSAPNGCDTWQSRCRGSCRLGRSVWTTMAPWQSILLERR